MALLNQPQHLRHRLQARNQFPGPVALLLQGCDLGRGLAEQEEVFGAHLLADLHIRPIKGADCEGAIHREFHVARAGGLHAGGGDLLGEIRRRIHPLAQLHVVIG